MQGGAGEPAATKQAGKKRRHEEKGTASHKATVRAYPAGINAFTAATGSILDGQIYLSSQLQLWAHSKPAMQVTQHRMAACDDTQVPAGQICMHIRRPRAQAKSKASKPLAEAAAPRKAKRSRAEPAAALPEGDAAVGQPAEDPDPEPAAMEAEGPPAGEDNMQLYA